MRRMTYFVMALAMVLGFTQCKKEQPAQNETEGVFITLTLDGGNSNSRVNVDPTGNNGLFNYATVQFEEGDVIYVGYNGSYVGTLTCQSGNTTFSGNINVTEEQATQPLDLYFLGGKDFALPTIDEENNTATLVISDQTASYPVISYARSTYQNGSHHAKLMNKCSIMKFNVTTRSTAPICITGMNNKVTLNFDPATPDTDEGFTYGINTEDGGLIKMPAKDANNETWAIVLPQDDLAASETNGSANSFDHPYYYSSTRPAIHKIESNKYYHENNDVIAMTMNSRVVDLSKLTAHYTAQDGDTLSGILNGESQPYKINVNTDGASITLRDATINGKNDEELCSWAGITCENNTTLVLKGTNTVTGFYENYPGIYIAQDKTLTISGEGTLNARSNGWAAGIGLGNGENCGNIIINSGIINATGGNGYAGIGGGFDAQCGDITINGGNITAQGGNYGAGIGSGFANHANSECGSISINDGNVTATGGLGGAGIGSGFSHRASNYINTSRCGNISITGGTVIATGGTNGEYQQSWYINGGAGIGTGYARNSRGNSNCGTITIGSGVTSVTATMGNDAQYSIGKSRYNSSGTCGTITIGCTFDEGGNPIGGTEYPNGISTSPYTYP